MNMKREDINRELKIGREWTQGKGPRQATFSGKNLGGENLSGTHLVEALFEDAYLAKTSFAGSKLSKASFDDAYMVGAILRGAELNEARMVKTDLRKADLTNADLRDASLYHADLTGAILVDANLEGADLRGAQLGGADVRGTILDTGVKKNMGHMEPELVKGDFWECYTSEGVHFVPYDQFTEKQLQQTHSLPVVGCKKISGYGARLTAPGYLDATDWVVFVSKAEAEEYLKSLTEDDEPESEPTPNAKKRDSGFYVTTYCNRAHRVSDGKPINHECVIIPPAALRAEMDGKMDLAIEIMQKSKPLRMMRRGVRA